ncbi:MAG: dodecin [Candidatus Binatota bacterium]|jgi:flavin-binding protein dodecin|nr:dodecin [Candidatus Binatota bacterium]
MVEKTIDLTGTSSTGIEDAVRLAVKRASLTIKNIRQAKMIEAVALVEESAITRWRVRVEVTFSVEEQLHE